MYRYSVLKNNFFLVIIGPLIPSSI